MRFCLAPRGAVLLLAGACLALGGCGEPPPTDTSPSARLARGVSPLPEETFAGLPLSQFHIEHDRFPRADDPEHVTAAEATWLLPDDEVFGVLVGRAARAYPISFLAFHHAVNDVLGGIPICVTY